MRSLVPGLFLAWCLVGCTSAVRREEITTSPPAIRAVGLGAEVGDELEELGLRVHPGGYGDMFRDILAGHELDTYFLSIDEEHADTLQVYVYAPRRGERRRIGAYLIQDAEDPLYAGLSPGEVAAVTTLGRLRRTAAPSVLVFERADPDRFVRIGLVLVDGALLASGELKLLAEDSLQARAMTGALLRELEERLAPPCPFAKVQPLLEEVSRATDEKLPTAEHLAVIGRLLQAHGEAWLAELALLDGPELIAPTACLTRFDPVLADRVSQGYYLRVLTEAADRKVALDPALAILAAFTQSAAEVRSRLPGLAEQIQRLLEAGEPGWTEEVKQQDVFEAGGRLLALWKWSPATSYRIADARVVAHEAAGQLFTAAGVARVCGGYREPAKVLSRPELPLLAVRGGGAGERELRARLTAKVPCALVESFPGPGVTVEEVQDLEVRREPRTLEHRVANDERRVWLDEKARAEARVQRDRATIATPIVRTRHVEYRQATKTVDEYGNRTRLDSSKMVIYDEPLEQEEIDEQERTKADAEADLPDALSDLARYRGSPPPETVLVTHGWTEQRSVGGVRWRVTPLEGPAFDLALDGGRLDPPHGAPSPSSGDDPVVTTEAGLARLRSELADLAAARLLAAWPERARRALEAHLAGVAPEQAGLEAAWGRFWLGLPATPEDAPYLPKTAEGLRWLTERRP